MPAGQKGSSLWFVHYGFREAEKRAKGPSLWSVHYGFYSCGEKGQHVRRFGLYTTVLVMWRKWQKGPSLV